MSSHNHPLHPLSGDYITVPASTSPLPPIEEASPLLTTPVLNLPSGSSDSEPSNSREYLPPASPVPATPITNPRYSRASGDPLLRTKSSYVDEKAPSVRSKVEELESSLPTLVENVRQGRVGTYNASAVVTTLFAGVEATLLTGSPPPAPSTGSFRGSVQAQRFYLWLTYSALALNLSATVASLLMIDILGSLPYHSRNGTAVKNVPRTARRLLLQYAKEYKARAYTAIEWHWYITFYAGSACIFCQFMTYIWLYESDILASTLTPIVAVSVLPFFFIVLL